jgi:hypothetical protein
LVQKLVALKFKQKVLIFRKIYTPKFLGCYSHDRGLGPDGLRRAMAGPEGEMGRAFGLVPDR